jgi:hypothetical protein
MLFSASGLGIYSKLKIRNRQEHNQAFSISTAKKLRRVQY